MKITQIEFEFGMTQNLGDYTNTRPSVKMVAEVTEDESPGKVLDYLDAMVRPIVHSIVDDELEAAGRKVKYYTGQLYRVYHSNVRQCILIAPVGAELPEESNWKHRDNWSSHSYDFPDEMRLTTAHRSADALLQRKGWDVFVCADGDLTAIPPLPDAGPEPLWYQKDLAALLEPMRIDKSLWEELAALEHVSAEYLQGIRREHGWGTSAETYLAFIRENKPFAEPEEEEEDEDWEDDE